MAKAITMADVAKAAGVHQTTVSLALRNHRSIPETTREKIKKLSLKMGYRPNPLVSALISERRRGKTSGKGSTLAFLTCFPNRGGWRASSNYVDVYTSMQKQAQERGYRIEEFWLLENGMSPARMKSILLARGIRGIIICPMPTEPRTLDFDFSEFAVVALGLTLQSPAIDRVAIDYSRVMDICVRGLKERGHKRIAFATNFEIDSRVNHLSLGAFLAERHRDRQSFIAPLTSERWTRDSFLNWVKKEKPDALITAISPDYIHFRQWLQSANPEIAASLKMVCVDCLVSDPKQGGVVQNLAAEAQAAVDLVTSRAERGQLGIPAHPQTILVSGSWRDGHTY